MGTRPAGSLGELGRGEHEEKGAGEMSEVRTGRGDGERAGKVKGGGEVPKNETASLRGTLSSLALPQQGTGPVGTKCSVPCKGVHLGAEPGGKA